ncbi:hypothetical protein HUJ05_009944 [Dendroctonus ponderosae]|nr:hypothetical protein HUJ05_009944 [Dendroctonus ponderosae]
MTNIKADNYNRGDRKKTIDLVRPCSKTTRRKSTKNSYGIDAYRKKEKRLLISASKCDISLPYECARADPGVLDEDEGHDPPCAGWLTHCKQLNPDGSKQTLFVNSLYSLTPKYDNTSSALFSYYVCTNRLKRIGRQRQTFAPKVLLFNRHHSLVYLFLF